MMGLRGGAVQPTHVFQRYPQAPIPSFVFCLFAIFCWKQSDQTQIKSNKTPENNFALHEKIFVAERLSVSFHTKFLSSFTSPEIFIKTFNSQIILAHSNCWMDVDPVLLLLTPFAPRVNLLDLNIHASHNTRISSLFS